LPRRHERVLRASASFICARTLPSRCDQRIVTEVLTSRRCTRCAKSSQSWSQPKVSQSNPSEALPGYPSRRRQCAGRHRNKMPPERGARVVSSDARSCHHGCLGADIAPNRMTAATASSNMQQVHSAPPPGRPAHNGPNSPNPAPAFPTHCTLPAHRALYDYLTLNRRRFPNRS